MTLFKFGLVTMEVLSARLLASNIATGYYSRKVFIFSKHRLRGS